MYNYVEIKNLFVVVLLLPVVLLDSSTNSENACNSSADDFDASLHSARGLYGLS